MTYEVSEFIPVQVATVRGWFCVLVVDFVEGARRKCAFFVICLVLLFFHAASFLFFAFLFL